MRTNATTTIIALLILGSELGAQVNPQERAAWNRPIKPFRIIGDVYYVGVEGVSAFLIATPSGAILLDGGFPETAPLIEKSISDLGFHLGDVKFLLNSHAHYDHCGGLTELKSRSGAKMIASQGDSIGSDGRWQLSCSDKARSFPPVAVDRIVGDNETVQVSDAILTAHLTPGHTKGCTTWSMTTTESGRAYHVVFYCSTSVAGNRLVDNREYPNIVSDYEQTFAKLRHMPCDVFLGPHGSFFQLDRKMIALQRGRKDVFVDRAEMQQYVHQSEQGFHKDLRKQRLDYATQYGKPTE